MISEIVLTVDFFIFLLPQKLLKSCSPRTQAAASSIRRQLREHHNQLTESVNPDAFEKDADDLIFIPEVDKFDAPAYQVVRSKEFEFGPMSVQDAILQMNLIGHSFFAFRNEDRDGAFSVVYRRNDGGYGVLVDKR